VRERDRFAALGQRGALGTADVDNAESAVEAAVAAEKSASAEILRARAALRSSRLDLDRTTIVSPIAGIVLARAVEEGQSVTAGFQTPTLFTVAKDLGEMEVRAAIDEADVGKVKEAQEARFSVDAYGEEEFAGRIAQIRRSPTVTQNVVTYEALIRVQNADKRLWPGMTATVRVVTARREDALRVPNAALRFKAPKDFGGGNGNGGGDKDRGDRDKRDGAKPKARAQRKVWRLGAGAPAPVELQIGIADDEYTEVTAGGLAPGDELVTEILDGKRKGGGPGGPGGGRQGRGIRM